MRLRFYESTHRGVHAACDVKMGDTIYFCPHEEIITPDWGYETPVGAQIKQANIPVGNRGAVLRSIDIIVTYILTEIYKKR